MIENTQVTLLFAPDGQAGGSGGCNSFSAAYQAEGTSVEIDEIISTLIACTEGGVAEQEAAYFYALRTAEEFEQTADQSVIYYNDGQGVLNFTPAMPAAGGSN